MRYRTSGDSLLLSGPHITTWDVRYPGNVVDLGPYYYKTQKYYNYMVDDPKRKTIHASPGVDIQVMKNAIHTKSKSNLYHDTVEFATSANNRQACNGLQVLGAFQSNPNMAGDITSSELLWLMSKCQNFADLYPQQFETLKPHMTTRANMTVFLWELSDLKRMFSLLPSKHLSVGLMRGKRRLGTWKDALKYVNSQHLNYNFGWKPFFQDIRNVMKGAANFELRLWKFLRDQNKMLRRHAINDPTTQSGSSDIATIYYPFRVRRDWEMSCLQASAADLSYTVPTGYSAETRWRAWLDTLGLNVSPAKLWAVIPWSFVVDWFINVGGQFKAEEANWCDPTLNLLQCCHSRKYTAKLTTTVYSTLGGTTPAVDVELSHYYRTAGLPNIDWSTNPLDADKIRLGSSLILSKVL